MSHVILLGDSIFDNAAYVGGGPEVIEQVQQRLPVGWQATLRAVDGSVTASVRRQLDRLPEDAGWLVVSVGGNDALGYADILGEKAHSAAEVLQRLAEIGDRFEHDYHLMLQEVLSRRLPTAICTVYYPRFPDPLTQRLAVTALTIFNDRILREAFAAGLPVLDLRLLCHEDADYANPIEPSVRGGEKIAEVIVKVVTEHDFRRRRTEVFIQ